MSRANKRIQTSTAIKANKQEHKLKKDKYI